MEKETNEGFNPAVIASLKEQMAASGRPYVLLDREEEEDEYVHFHFVGKYEGQEVIYDTALYTLRLHHESELFEIAERRAIKQFPDYEKLILKEDQPGAEAADEADPREEEIGLFLAEVIMELEEEESVKVKEHIDVDLDVDFGVCLDVGLHVEKITAVNIEKFIREFNAGGLKLDETLYSFQTHDDQD